MNAEPEPAPPAEPKAAPIPEPTPSTEPAPEGKTAAPLLCYSCGKELAGGDARCPSCGAPVRPLRTRRGASRLRIAAYLFLGLAVLTGYYGYVLFQVGQSSDALFEGGELTDETFLLTGNVTDENGTALAGVLVSPKEDLANGSRTDANGSFALPNLTLGAREVHFQLANHTTVRLRMYTLSDLDVDVTLSLGDGSEAVQHASLQSYLKNVRTLGSTLLATGGLYVATAVACFLRRFRYLAYAGAVFASAEALLGVFAVITGNPTVIIPVILAVTATVFVFRNRKDFR